MESGGVPTPAGTLSNNCVSFCRTGIGFTKWAMYKLLTAHLHRHQNGSRTVLMPSVNAHRTVLNRSVPRRTVLPQVGGLYRSRTVPSASINKTVRVERY